MGEVKKYVIKWKVLRGSEAGQGEPVSSRKIAQDWADSMNSQYPHIKHWVEEVKE
jgi:hypothetical protein